MPVVIVIGLNAALLFARQINPAKPSADITVEQQCTVSGAVVSATTGQPLNDAIVTMNEVGGRHERRSAVTDAGGRFGFKDVEPGRYFLSAEHTGYVRMAYGQRIPGGPSKILRLSPGEAADRISFALIPGGVITGHVYDERGEPIEHARVLALRYRYLDGRRRLLPAGSAVTDDRGQYRLFDLGPGKYHVSASANPMGPGVGFSYGPSYYPGVSEASQASPVILQAGNEFPGVNFTLQRVGVFHVRGQVISSVSNLPLTNISVRLASRADPFGALRMGTRIKDAQGDFDIPGVRPGSYFLVAQLSAKGKSLQARQAVTVMDSDVDSIRLNLSYGATLEGAIHARGPVDLSRVRISLRPREGAFFRRYSSSVQGAHGSFEFHGLPDGRYVIRAFGLPQDAYIKSATLGGEDALDSGFEIANGEASGSMLDVVIDPDGGRIGGTMMLNGKSLSEALVTLLPDDSSKLADDLWFKSTTTDKSGNFTVTGIRPGNYRLFAWEEIVPGEEGDPAFLDNFKDSGREVQVTPRSALNLQLSAVPASKIKAVEAQ